MSSKIIKKGTIVTADRTYTAVIEFEDGKITLISDSLSCTKVLDQMTIEIDGMGIGVEIGGGDGDSYGDGDGGGD